MTGSLNKLKLYVHQPNFGIDANRYFAALPTTPSLSCRVVINTHMVTLANAGILKLLDCLYYHVMPTQAQVLVNAANPGTFNLVLTNTVTHTAGVGDQGDGVTGFYQTGMARNLGTTHFSQNSAMIGFYCQTTGQASGFAMGTSSGTVCRLNPRTNVDTITTRINDTLSLAIANTNASGSYASNRSASTARQVYMNGSSVTSDTRVSSAVGADTIQILNDNGSCSNAKLAISYVGSSLTAAQHSVLSTANALLVAQAATACLL